MVDLGLLFTLPIVRCHHKERRCRFAIRDPHYTFFADGRRMDLWITRCFVGREYGDCEDYRSHSGCDCADCEEGLLSDEREDSFDERRGADLLWNEARGCKFIDYGSTQRNMPKMSNG